MNWLDALQQIEEFEDAEFDTALVAEMERHAADNRERLVRFSTPTFKEFDYSIVGAPMPHPGLNGKRVKSPVHPAVYFVWNGGYKCWIPNPHTYNSIFRSWDGILEIDPDELAAIASGPTLTNGALMARPEGFAPVYLLTNYTKNWVTAPRVMDYCNFKWPPTLPPIIFEFIPNGINIDYGD